MKRAWITLRLIVAAGAVATSATLPARGDYLTFDIASHEAMADYVRFESRSWAEDAEGEGGRLAANTTWSGGEHVILNDLYIPSGVTLTINAGTVVKFREGTRIKVEDGGSIVLNGELGNEIVLEGYEEDTSFKGIVFQSGSANYFDNGYIIVRGIAFGRFATVSINDTEAFMGGGQALVPVNVSGSRDTAFSFDWVAETNGVQFASGAMNWNRVSDGSKNITVPYPDGLPGCSNFTVRATTLRCCTATKGTCKVNLSEFITTSIYTHEAMADYIPFESRDWAEGVEGDGGRLSSNVVWSGTHKIVSDVYIPSGVTLTLTADTVVEFCEGTRIKIEDGGTLNIVGADGHDVILRGAEGVANFGGIVKMPNGTFTDNSYFRFEGFTYGALANVALHDSSTFRSSGLALIPVTVSGSRSTAFSIDWVAETNGAPYKTGTLKWNNVSEGTKNISINYGAELDGYTNFTLRAAVDRACKTSPNTCTIKISDFIVSDIASHESMAEYIRFESRDWAADLEGEGGRLAANATWEGTHKIASDVYIPSGVTLTLAADAVVEFYEGTRIKIEDGGALNIVGANGHDVIIRGAEGVTNYVGVVKMPNGTYTDNMYVQYTDRPYSAYPYITVHEATTYRDAGKMWIVFSLSGTTRNQSFNIDWSTDKGDSGTLTWSSSSDGTKWIEIPIAAEPVGGTTNHVITITASRACNISVGEATLTVQEPDYVVKGQVALAESESDSGDFTVNGDIKTQPLFLNDTETVQYSGKWQPYDANEAAVLRVTLETDNGATVLKEVSPSETGAFDLNLKQYPVGYYTLKHEILNDLGETLATMQKTFSIADDEDVVLHGGVLASNEVWAADKVHVVYETVVVPSVYTIFIEPGAIVKFMTGTGIDISQGGAFFANRIVFTHINDDTVGGDTLNDGFTVAPPMDAYFLSGAFTFGDDTELRGITQNNALTGTIATQKTLSRGSTYRVSGTLTIASGGSLTIPPGTVLKMEDKAAIVVNSGATLNAIGTRAAPITFTSIKDDTISGDTNGDGSNTIPQPGDWEEIKNNGGTMNLAFVTALYGGYGQYANQGDAIIRTANGETKMDCCVVKHSNLRLVGRTGGTVYAENCILEDGRWGIDGAVTFVNGVIANCNTGANGATLKNSILWECDTYASGGTASNCVAYGEIATVQTGMTYADPLFVDPVNGDFRVKEGSPCVDAADGAVAPELDFYGQPRITITDHGDELVGQLADIGVCEVMPRDVVSDIDLVPQSVRTTTNAVPGQLLFVKWEIANVGGREVEAAWRDTVSLVSESGREVVLGVKTTSSRIGVGGSVFCSGYFTVPAIAEGTWYPKVNVNSYHDIFEGSLSANNALTGERAVSVGLEALDPSISREGVINGGTPTVLKLAFGENDDNRMVNFDVPAGVKATWGFGFMPGGSRSVATASGFMTATSDGVMFRVPDGATDVYVVLESDTTTTYNLSTESTQMTITSVTPATLPSSGTTTLTITGAGFGETNALSLISPVGRVALNVPQKDASGNLIATVDCATLTAGQTYAVRVENGENAAELPGAVSVVKAEGKGILELEYDVPSSVRPGRVFTFTVTYRNTGNKDMCVPILTVQDTGNDAVNPIQFSLDGERFTPGGFQFVGNDAEGGFGPLHPGDEVTLLLMAKIPPANNGSTAVSVRANTESDIMAKYTTEIDRYLTPSMKAEFAATTDAELKARGERMAQVFGANNGEMVRNFAALAERFVECNGFALQKVEDLLPYGAEVVEATKESNRDGNMATNFEEVSGTRTGTLNPTTGTYLKRGSSFAKLDDINEDLTGLRVAVIAHGWKDGLLSGWMQNMGNALEQSGHFDAICYVNWQAEAHTYVDAWGASGAIVQIAPVVYQQLSNKKITPSNVTFIGHSFGSHLLANVANYFKLAGKGTIARHIGLDTAETAVVYDHLEASGNCAERTEYYRTSPGSGRNDAYASENYIVCKENGFDSVGFLDMHSYAWRWFISNIDSIEAKNNKIGFWSEKPPLINGTGFRGVINGDKQKYECVYKYGEGGFNYPGNKPGWLEMRNAWLNAVDIETAANLNNGTEVEADEKFAVGVTAKDNADIKTLTRDYDYRLDVSFVRKDGQVTSLISDDQQTSGSFNKNLKIPESVIPEDMDKVDGKLVFTIIAGKMYYCWESHNEMYMLDNTDEVEITVKRSGLPSAVINGEDQDGFTLHQEIVYASQEEYDEAVKNGDTFSYTFDGSGSTPGKKRKITSYSWGASSITRKYSATSSACYPISLTVCNDINKEDTVSGQLDVSVVIKKEGDPIEQPKSYDPNEMRGKLGLGDPETQRFVKPGEELTYTIYFENKTNATAAAQEVYVTNPLNEWLDWSTFKMHEVAFGDQIDLGLVDKSSGTSEVTMKGTNFVVRTELVLESTDGTSVVPVNGQDARYPSVQARWYMRIVDPTTDTGWPADIVAGFLPPNDETHRGEGHITYSICVRADAPANLVISNSADIVFDHNPTIKTDPAWWNTVAFYHTPKLDLGDGVTTNLLLIAGQPFGELPTPPGRKNFTFDGWYTGPNGTGIKATSDAIVPDGEFELYENWIVNGGIAKFEERDVVTEEGSNAVVRVYGGNTESACSVNVYLTYNTAAAADVDLAKGTVDGTTPKGGLKFPLALTWEAGEVGEKAITIPVKTDKTVEGDEFFTLQLAEAEGMELGEERVCTVTIHDATVAAGKETLQDAVNNAVVKMSTSGKGKWAYAVVGTGGEVGPGKTASASAMSPALKAGEMSELKAAAVKGSGTLTFDVRVANPNLEGESPETAEGAAKTVLTLLDGKVELLAWTNETDWTSAAYTVEEAKATSHAFTWRVVQGADLGARAYVANVVWSPAGTEMRALTLSAASYANGEPCDDPSAGGTVSGGGVYPDKTKAAPVATANVGWEFVGWAHGDGGRGATALPEILSNKAKWQVVVTNDAEYVAVFEKIPYIRGLADPADGGKVSGSGLCARGKKVTLKATASKNYTFLGWRQGTGNGELGTGNGFVATTAALVIDRSTKPAANSKTSTTITEVDGDVTYFAVFKSDPKVTVSVEDTDEKGAVPTGKGAGKYVAGTITGEGKYAPGKKVTLKATANKNYVFAGWARGGRGATALPDDGGHAGRVTLPDDVISQAASLSFEMPSNDVGYVAMFVTADEDKGSIELAVNGEEMRLAGDGSPYRTNVWCGVYLEWPVAASALSEPKVKVAGLPAGLKFTDKPVTSKIGSGKTAVTVTNILANTIYGAPTAASKVTTDRKTGAVTITPSAVKVTVTTAGKSTQTYQIDAVVDALPAWAQGTFAGYVRGSGTLAASGEDGSGEGSDMSVASPKGTVSLTVSAAGKVSGKAQGDELTYTLAAPYYSGFELADGVSNFVADVTASWSYKEGTKTVNTNEVVQMVVQDNGIGGLATAVEGWFEAYTVNWKAEPWKTLGKSFDKKTVTYAILADGSFSEDEEVLTAALSADVPARVTLKFAASGAVSVAGEFVTGYNEKTKKYTTVKATGSATLVPVDDDHGEVFIYLTPKGLAPHARCLNVPWPQE